MDIQKISRFGNWRFHVNFVNVQNSAALWNLQSLRRINNIINVVKSCVCWDMLYNISIDLN